MDELGPFLEGVTAGVEGALRETLEWGEEQAMGRALELSSGPYSSAALRKMGYPFAVERHPSPLLDPTVINVQSGVFLGGWQPVGVHGEGAGLVAGARNDSPEAEVLRRGTRYMFERPLEQRVLNELEGPIQAHLERVVESEIGGTI